jgi:hypothetical protein
MDNPSDKPIDAGNSPGDVQSDDTLRVTSPERIGNYSIRRPGQPRISSTVTSFRFSERTL